MKILLQSTRNMLPRSIYIGTGHGNCNKKDYCCTLSEINGKRIMLLSSGIIILDGRYLELLFQAGASSCRSLCLDLLEAADKIG